MMERMDFAVDVTLAYATRDQLSVLATEIYNQDFVHIILILLAAGVVRGLLCYGDVMRMVLGNGGSGYFYKFGVM